MHYITLQCITLHYITCTYIHACMHMYKITMAATLKNLKKETDRQKPVTRTYIASHHAASHCTTFHHI